MILLFSEYKSDYSNYIFPYAIWAIPEAHETPAQIFAKGFLPSSRLFDRFYLCRQIRVQLDRYEPSSENRRIFRKGADFTGQLLPRSAFDYNDYWRDFCKSYADAKFNPNGMSRERLDNLFAAPITSHVIVFKNIRSGQNIGLVTLYLEEPEMAFYYYSFYDLAHFSQNLGMYMMTFAVRLFAEKGYKWLYLGSCYSSNAMYKTQFRGVQFFNGFTWNENLHEIKFMLQRDAESVNKHLLEMDTFQNQFYNGSLENIKNLSVFKLL